MLFEILIWMAITIILARLIYIIGITLYTYNLTDKRLKGFPQYRKPNIFLHGPVTSAASRLVPYPTPHAMVSACIYDVHRKPLKIQVRVPDGVYWSITFHGRNQDCYFTLNDIDAKQIYGQDIEIILKKREITYKKNKNEIIVSAPHFSKRGLILIRIIMMNPSDKEETKRITNIQRMVKTEILEID
jgi:uncharacterized membrane protein